MKTKLIKRIIAPLLFACALTTLVAADKAAQGSGKAEDFKGLGSMQITLTDCAGHVIRSFPSLTRIRGGRHRGGVERRDTAGSEDAWRRCLAPYH